MKPDWMDLVFSQARNEKKKVKKRKGKKEKRTKKKIEIR